MTSATTRVTARTTGAARASTGRKAKASTRPPSRVKIGPVTFGVEYSLAKVTEVEEDQQFEGMTLSGASIARHQRILVRPGMGPDWTRETFLHEILHMLFSVAWPHLSADDEEKVVNGLSGHLLTFVRDNPKAIAYLQERS